MPLRQLTIERFKSINSVSLECRKVNVFIGEPDTGKTNILEALKFLSCLSYGCSAAQAVRLTQEPGWESLFFQGFTDQPIRVVLDDLAVTMGIMASHELDISYQGTSLRLGLGQCQRVGTFRYLRWYEYAPASAWGYAVGQVDDGAGVEIPFGGNLLYLVQHNRAVHELLANVARELGYLLRFDRSQGRLWLSQVRENRILDYGLELLSDSHKRLFFYSAVIETSKSVVLVMDEPDVHAFPPYPKTLGERIADDQTNQFFLTTHNPYFLQALVAKTPVKDLAVYVCRRLENGETAANLLSADQCSAVLEQGANVFFNLEELVGS